MNNFRSFLQLIINADTLHVAFKIFVLLSVKRMYYCLSIEILYSQNLNKSMLLWLNALISMKANTDISDCIYHLHTLTHILAQSLMIPWIKQYIKIYHLNVVDRLKKCMLITWKSAKQIHSRAVQFLPTKPTIDSVYELFLYGSRNSNCIIIRMIYLINQSLTQFTIKSFWNYLFQIESSNIVHQTNQQSASGFASLNCSIKMFALNTFRIFCNLKGIFIT